MRALCECGCGEPAPIARQNHPRYGWVKGEPLRFVRGHNNRGRQIKATRYVVEDRGYETPCWIWQLDIRESGYGCVWIDGRNQPAHRYYWEQAHGPVPDGLVLDHLCSTRPCVNPAHLEPVTHNENCWRGRGSKLTVGDVHEIRRLIAEGSLKQVDIAARFGVAPATVTDIKKGRKWASA